jgi:hypothetical protein
MVAWHIDGSVRSFSGSSQSLLCLLSFSPRRTRFMVSLRLRLLLTLAHLVSPPFLPASLVSTSATSIIDVGLRQGINLLLAKNSMLTCAAKMMQFCRSSRGRVP